MPLKHAKFDSFLKRILPNKEYKEVRTCEPCVVTSSRDKNAFRFTFLTNIKIYITENPPKTLLYAVHLKDVVDVFMVNDQANFLQASLRDRVQHIIVKYIAATKNKSIEDKGNPSKSQALAALQYSSINQEDQASTSKHASPPVLCSYADISTIEGNHESSLALTSSEDPDSARSWMQATTKRKSMTKAVEAKATSHWELKDPYPIQVFIPGNKDESSYSFEKLHLYILDNNTSFLPLLKSLWKNYIVNMTLHSLDVEKMSPEKSVSMDETTKMLFADLKQELMQSKGVEQLYGLYNELKVAASQDILIKSLFWKDDILLRRSVELIGNFVTNGVSVDIEERADEIELNIVILQTLAVVLREAEAVPQCYRLLQNWSRRFFTDTVNTLLSEPRLLHDSWAHNRDIKALLMESTISACEALYQLMICAQQMTWVIDGKSQVFNSGSLFSALEKHEHLSAFLDRLIGSCIHIWDMREKSCKHGRYSSGGVEPLLPEDAVKIFFLLTLFHRIISNCPMVAHHAKCSYQEEFKYYISPGSVEMKLPIQYPISAMARSVVHAAGYFVTGMGACSK